MSGRPDPEVAFATSGRGRRSPGAGPLALRIAVFVPMTLITALVAHGLGGGGLVPAAAMLAPTALALIGASALLVVGQLLGARSGWGSIGAVTACAQLAGHLVGRVGAGGGASTAGSACCSPMVMHHHHAAGMAMPSMPGMSSMPSMPGMPPMPGVADPAAVPPGSAGMAMPAHDVRMLAAHVLAAAVTATLLRCGERMLLAVLRAMVPRLPAAPLGVVPATWGSPPMRAPRRDVRAPRRPGGVGRRGPPLPQCPLAAHA